MKRLRLMNGELLEMVFSGSNKEIFDFIDEKIMFQDGEEIGIKLNSKHDCNATLHDNVISIDGDEDLQEITIEDIKIIQL